jgi:uncharacterized protein (DUF1800 family)
VRFRLVWCLSFCLLLAACGGGGGGGSSGPAPNEPEPPTEPEPLPPVALPIGEEAAARFLTQATFGPTADEIRALAQATSYEAWLANQAAKPVSLQLDYLDALPLGTILWQGSHVEAWWMQAVRGPDQLRQRVAFALSQILVVSDNSPLNGYARILGAYYDILSTHALGNYRELLEQVTLSHAMGRYLSMFQNQKPDLANGIRADENYAREIMQLFTIGLVELNANGTPRLDGSGNPIPTYTQADIENLARVFTGWSWGGGTLDLHFWGMAAPNVTGPMSPYAAYHDFGAKTLVGGVQLPAGLSPREDLERALDVLFAHPNVGPFVGRQLIQRLVTSNPSPAYVARVASVFNDNGAGVRGDLNAVVRAILLDPEARQGHLASPQTFGKLREPLIRLAHLWRVFDAANRIGTFTYFDPSLDFGQAPLRSPSVFNFFRPDYRPTGALADAGLYAPEFQIVTEASVATTGNALAYAASSYLDSLGGNLLSLPDLMVYLDYEPWEAIVATPAELVDELDLVFMSGQMPADMRAALLAYLAQFPDHSTAAERLREVVLAIVLSPQQSIQR